MRCVAALLIAAAALPAAALAQVETRPAHGTGQKPAFAGQTRAPQAPARAEWTATVVASGLAKPWAVDQLPDGRFLVTEKGGALRLVGLGGEISAPLANVPKVQTEKQGGLLDVTLAPDGKSVCLTYAEPVSGGAGTAAACGLLDLDNGANPGLRDMRVVWRQTPAYANGMHFGARVLFAGEDLLYITTGERSDMATRARAQDVDTGYGKTIRVRRDGTPPEDNPFYSRGNGARYVWSYGHRNIQSAALDREGRLWTVEHGPKGGDELNLPQPGKNYGWPVITYGVEYSGAPVGDGLTAKAGMEQPIYYWDPVIGPSGMAVYSGKAFPGWAGNVLVGGLVSKSVVRLELADGRVTGEEHLPIGARVRDVIEGRDGFVYVLTDEDNGRLIRIAPKA